jgi:hypothetical protein
MLSFVTCLPLCIGCHLLCSSYDFLLSIHHSPLLCIGCKLFHLASILDPLHWTCSLSTVVVLSLLVRPFALEASNLFILEASVSSLVSLSICTKILTNFHYCMMLKLFLVSILDKVCDIICCFAGGQQVIEGWCATDMHSGNRLRTHFLWP